MSTQVFELERGLPIPTCYATSQCKEDSALKVNKKGTKQKKEKQGEKGVESLKDLNTRVPKPVRYQVLSSLPHSAQRSAEGAPATSMALLCAQRWWAYSCEALVL